MMLDIVYGLILCHKDTAFFKTKNNFMYFSIKILRNITFLPVLLIIRRYCLLKMTEYQATVTCY